MTFKDCIKFAGENPVSFLATIDNNQPRVRAVMLWYADESGFYFQTFDTKDFQSQLKNNPKTEVCFHRERDMVSNMLRVAGEVQFLEDKSLMEKVFKTRPFLRNLGYTPDSPGVVIFRIEHGVAYFFNSLKIHDPKVFINF